VFSAHFGVLCSLHILACVLVIQVLHAYRNIAFIAQYTNKCTCGCMCVCVCVCVLCLCNEQLLCSGLCSSGLISAEDRLLCVLG